MKVPYHPYPMKIEHPSESEDRRYAGPPKDVVVVRPPIAWRILNQRTHGSISRATFYRWISEGRVFSFRVGYRMYVPMLEIDTIVNRCYAGERF